MEPVAEEPPSTTLANPTGESTLAQSPEILENSEMSSPNLFASPRESSKNLWSPYHTYVPSFYRSGFAFPGLNRIPSLQEFLKASRESIRPWTQFCNTANFKAPPNLSRLLKRAVNNIKYFQGNYIVISITLMAYCLLTSPLLLLSVAASLIACYLLTLRNAEKKLKFGNKEVTLHQQYGIVGVCSLPLYYWAGVGQAVFWVLGASCFVIGLHAGTYNIEEVLSPDDQLTVLLQV